MKKGYRCVVELTSGHCVTVGSKVFINHSCMGQPIEVRLLAVRCDSDWPFQIEQVDGSPSWWAHVYACRDEAIAADPQPEIQRLKREIQERTEKLARLEERYCKAINGDLLNG